MNNNLKKNTNFAKYSLGVIQDHKTSLKVYKIVVLLLNRSFCDFLGSLIIDSSNNLKIIWIDKERLHFWLSKKIKINKFLYNLIKSELKRNFK